MFFPILNKKFLFPGYFNYNSKMRTENLILLLLVISFFQISHSFDIRSGMSAPWNSLRRNPQVIKSSNQTSKLKKRSDQLKSTPFTEKFYKAKVDHFAYDNKDSFDLRFLISDKYYINGGPILFYCGNEGSIEDFWGASGFITEELAKSFHGLVLFAEHRFFGKSFPYDWKAQDYDIKKNRYLTVEQALHDFVDLIQDFKKTNKTLENSPVIAFGGSYGGMLAAWSRMKFPHVYAGAVASSAPILLFEDINVIQNSFFRIATETYKRYDDNCPGRIREGFRALFNLRNSTFLNQNPEIIEEINQIFNPCQKMTKIEELNYLEAVIEDAVIELAQYNYPYETHFLNPLPAYPAKVACEKTAAYEELTKPFSILFQTAYSFSLQKYGKIDDETKRKLNYLKIAIDVYYHTTGTLQCLEIGNNVTISPPPNGWEYLACTEMVMPMEKNGETDMFNPIKWDFEQFKNQCISKWGADIRPEFAYNFYGGRNYLKDFHSYSNIYFINGKMDPWNAGCVQRTPNPEAITVFLADSAHHLDLRSPNKDDPDSINRGREIMGILIRKWIMEYLKN